MTSGKKNKHLFTVLAVAVIGLVGAGAFLMYRDSSAPGIFITPDSPAFSKSVEITVTAEDIDSGVKSLTVKALRDEQSVTLLNKTYAEVKKAVSEPVTLKNLNFSDGIFQLDITAVDGSLARFAQGNHAHTTRRVVLDTVKPSATVVSGPHNIKRGGSCLISYLLSEEAVTSGVQVGDTLFPGYKQPDGRHYCLFAFPFYIEKNDFRPKLTATDIAGNTMQSDFAYYATNKRFPHDAINLSDGFFDSKMPDFEEIFPGEMSGLERFLLVNRELRKRNRQELRKICLQSYATPFEQESFIRMSGKTMAGFGDIRSYKYKNKDVDEQTHLGVDIASVKHAPIPAAATGSVIHADYMGIYGNVVIVDHGLGLQTLYAHLSEFNVSVKDTIDQGATLGKTGKTGLAGGDHLHFAVLVSGIPVDPLEWWDPNWLKNNIFPRFN